MNNLTWIATNASAIGAILGICTFLISFASLAWSAWRFVAVRRDEQAQRKFENYHKLIGELVGGARENQQMKIDSQIAIVFELRNFPKYAPVSVRILIALRDEWHAKGTFSRLIKEMDLAIESLS
jgi:hypothetical protein